MPLADDGGGVACLPEHRREGDRSGADQQRVNSRNHTGAGSAPGIRTGEQGEAARRAGRGGRMHVGETHALAGQAVDARGGHDAGPVTGDIAKADIIAIDDHDVRFGGDRRTRWKGFGGPCRERDIVDHREAGPRAGVEKAQPDLVPDPLAAGWHRVRGEGEGLVLVAGHQRILATQQAVSGGFAIDRVRHRIACGIDHMQDHFKLAFESVTVAPVQRHREHITRGNRPVGCGNRDRWLLAGARARPTAGQAAQAAGFHSA